MSISIGNKASLTHTVSHGNVLAIAEITGDRNPLHLDEAFASQSRFGKPIAHGIMSMGLISAVIGTKLPGPGSIYLSQSLKFHAPVFIGDTITAIVEVIDIHSDKPIFTLKTVVVNQKGIEVVSGEAVVYGNIK